jgi:WD40 repeat protein
MARPIPLVTLAAAGLLLALAADPVFPQGGLADKAVTKFAADPRQVLDGHKGRAILAVAWSGDGAQLASACGEKVIVWDVSNAQVLHTLKLPGVKQCQLAWGEKWLAAAAGNDVLVWEAATGKPQPSLAKAHPGGVLALAWSRDGKLLASAGADTTVKVWDAKGQLVHTLTAHTHAVRSVAWGPDGNLLASADANGNVRVWDLKNGTNELFPRMKDAIEALAWSPDGKKFVTVDDASAVKFWDVAKAKFQNQVKGKLGKVQRLAWDADSRLLAMGGPTAEVALWEMTGKRQVWAVLQVADDKAPAFAFSPDGKTLAAGGQTGKVRLWDVPAK